MCVQIFRKKYCASGYLPCPEAKRFLSYVKIFMVLVMHTKSNNQNPI